jgi:hypothetical protein
LNSAIYAAGFVTFHHHHQLTMSFDHFLSIIMHVHHVINSSWCIRFDQNFPAMWRQTILITSWELFGNVTELFFFHWHFDKLLGHTRKKKLVTDRCCYIIYLPCGKKYDLLRVRWRRMVLDRLSTGIIFIIDIFFQISLNFLKISWFWSIYYNYWSNIYIIIILLI